MISPGFALRRHAHPRLGPERGHLVIGARTDLGAGAEAHRHLAVNASMSSVAHLGDRRHHLRLLQADARTELRAAALRREPGGEHVRGRVAMRQHVHDTRKVRVRHASGDLHRERHGAARVRVDRQVDLDAGPLIGDRSEERRDGVLGAAPERVETAQIGDLGTRAACPQARRTRCAAGQKAPSRQSRGVSWQDVNLHPWPVPEAKRTAPPLQAPGGADPAACRQRQLRSISRMYQLQLRRNWTSAEPRIRNRIFVPGDSPRTHHDDQPRRQRHCSALQGARPKAYAASQDHHEGVAGLHRPS